MLKIIRCEGNGQGSCKGCDDKGIWNRHWICFLYKIQGQEGCYCEKWRNKKMRLIDADEIIDSLGGSDMDFAIGAVIDEQPTAFDVDKVISELKRDKFIESECILSDVHQGYNAGLNRAIEIVKGGWS